MVIEVDTRQKAHKHEAKHNYLASQGHTLIRTKLYVGDYRAVGGRVCVDTKQSMGELALDLYAQHERFRAECINAQKAGYYLIVLTENPYGIDSASVLWEWSEPEADFKRRKRAKMRLDGARMAKVMHTMSERYGVYWAFCHPDVAGRAVADLLTEGGERRWIAIWPGMEM